MRIGSYKQPRIRLLRNKRVIEGTSIKPNLPESITGTKNKYGAQRIYGEIHLKQFSVNYQKTGFNEDLSGVYSGIREILIDKNNLIQQAENYRLRPKNTKGKDIRDEQTVEGKVSGHDKTSQSSEDSGTHSKKSKTFSRIDKSDELSKALGRTKNNKLPKLYNSLCIVSLRGHPILMYVGVWSFLESLANLMGKNDRISFESFLSIKVNVFYKDDKQKKLDVRNVISDIHGKGNSIKHSDNRYIVDGGQLHNDFEVLEEFLIHCLNEL